MQSIFLSHSILFCQSVSLTFYLSICLSHCCAVNVSPCLTHFCSVNHFLTLSLSLLLPLYVLSLVFIHSESCRFFVFIFSLFAQFCAVHLPLSPRLWQSFVSHVLSGFCRLHIVLSHVFTHSLTRHWSPQVSRLTHLFKADVCLCF